MSEPTYIEVEWLGNVQPEIAAMHALDQVMEVFDQRSELISDQSAQRIATWFHDKYMTRPDAVPE